MGHEYVELKKITNPFMKDDEVLVRNFVAKFPDPKWTGPHKVTKAFGVNVQVEGTGRPFPTFHVNNVKLLKKAPPPEDSDVSTMEVDVQESALEEGRGEEAAAESDLDEVALDSVDGAADYTEAGDAVLDQTEPLTVDHVVDEILEQNATGEWFKTKWTHGPVTWEPISHFVDPDGTVTSQLLDFAKDHNPQLFARLDDPVEAAKLSSGGEE